HPPGIRTRQYGEGRARRTRGPDGGRSRRRRAERKLANRAPRTESDWAVAADIGGDAGSLVEVHTVAPAHAKRGRIAAAGPVPAHRRFQFPARARRPGRDGGDSRQLAEVARAHARRRRVILARRRYRPGRVEAADGEANAADVIAGRIRD